jgi:hypothetical protein
MKGFAFKNQNGMWYCGNSRSGEPLWQDEGMKIYSHKAPLKTIIQRNEFLLLCTVVDIEYEIKATYTIEVEARQSSTSAGQ